MQNGTHNILAVKGVFQLPHCRKKKTCKNHPIAVYPLVEPERGTLCKQAREIEGKKSVGIVVILMPILKTQSAIVQLVNLLYEF